MSGKVYHNINKGRVSSFSMRQFADVEKGKKDYVIRSFADDEEISVQDFYSAIDIEEPETITTKEDEITDDDYLPPSKLAKAEDGLVGETVEFTSFGDSKTFVESDVFSDNSDSKDYDETLVKSDNEELFNPADNIATAEEIEEYENKIKELEAKISQLESEKEGLNTTINEKDTIIEEKNKEIESINSSIPLQIEEAKKVSFDEGYKKAETECNTKYEADKNDYMQSIEKFNSDTVSKLDEIIEIIKNYDEQIPETVLGFVKAIVGAERKFNDKFIVTLINNNLNRIKELKDISFVVNPADLEVVKGALPDYVVSTDTSLSKGCVKINSKIGEVTLDSKVMIEDLERQINEEIGASENS